MEERYGQASCAERGRAARAVAALDGGVVLGGRQGSHASPTQAINPIT